jgi:hypothetical protein
MRNVDLRFFGFFSFILIHSREIYFLKNYLSEIRNHLYPNVGYHFLRPFLQNALVFILFLIKCCN